MGGIERGVVGGLEAVVARGYGAARPCAAWRSRAHATGDEAECCAFVKRPVVTHARGGRGIDLASVLGACSARAEIDFATRRRWLTPRARSPASFFLGDEFVWIGPFPRPKE